MSTKKAPKPNPPAMFDIPPAAKTFTVPCGFEWGNPVFVPGSDARQHRHRCVGARHDHGSHVCKCGAVLSPPPELPLEGA